MKKLLALLLALVMALSMTACVQDEITPETTASTEATIPADGSELGEGATTFTFEVVMKDETKYTYTIHTDKEILGEVLLDLGLVSGEQGDYGLYVTSVLGVALDYSADGYWWSLTVNGESATTGADGVTIEEGGTYAFVATPA